LIAGIIGENSYHSDSCESNVLLPATRANASGLLSNARRDPGIIPNYIPPHLSTGSDLDSESQAFNAAPVKGVDMKRRNSMAQIQRNSGKQVRIKSRCMFGGG
jgi:hypothetical protein